MRITLFYFSRLLLITRASMHWRGQLNPIPIAIGTSLVDPLYLVESGVSQTFK